MDKKQLKRLLDEQAKDSDGASPLAMRLLAADELDHVSGGTHQQGSGGTFNQSGGGYNQGGGSFTQTGGSFEQVGGNYTMTPRGSSPTPQG